VPAGLFAILISIPVEFLFKASLTCLKRPQSLAGPIIPRVRDWPIRLVPWLFLFHPGALVGLLVARGDAIAARSHLESPRRVRLLRIWNPWIPAPGCSG